MRVTRILVILVAMAFGLVACSCSADNANASNYPNPALVTDNFPAANDYSPPTVGFACNSINDATNAICAMTTAWDNDTGPAIAWTSYSLTTPTITAWACEYRCNSADYLDNSGATTTVRGLENGAPRKITMLTVADRTEGNWTIANIDYETARNSNSPPATTWNLENTRLSTTSIAARDCLLTLSSNVAYEAKNDPDNSRAAPTSAPAAVTAEESMWTVEENQWARGTPTTPMLADNTAKKMAMVSPRWT